MATKFFDARVQHKRDTDINWALNDPVLLNGELIVVDVVNVWTTQDGDTIVDHDGNTITIGDTSGQTASVRFKIGDGVSPYSELPFVDRGEIGTAVVYVDEENAVGYAEVGTAATDTPTYTPSGDVVIDESDTIEVTTAVQLQYSYNDYKLTISGVTATTATASIPTKMRFEGNGVKLKAEFTEEESE